MFKKKQKPPLDSAIYLVNHAIDIAWKYQRDKKFIPSDDDFKKLDILLEAFWQNHCTLEYIIRCLKQRKNEKPEGAQKFTNPESFDYHFPNYST